MKKMRHFLTLIFLVVSMPMVFAQASQDCTIKYNLFKGDYNASNYDKAYDNWMWCMDNCPTLSVNIYKLGIKIAEHKLETASEADKPAARELVMRVYTQRLEHFPKDKAGVYDDIASFKREQGASDDEVYEWLEKTFKEDPTALSAKNIYKYFDIILVKYKDSDTQRVFDTYDEVGEALELKRED